MTPRTRHLSTSWSSLLYVRKQWARRAPFFFFNLFPRLLSSISRLFALCEKLCLRTTRSPISASSVNDSVNRQYATPNIICAQHEEAVVLWGYLRNVGTTYFVDAVYLNVTGDQFRVAWLGNITNRTRFACILMVFAIFCTSCLLPRRISSHCVSSW